MDDLTFHSGFQAQCECMSEEVLVDVVMAMRRLWREAEVTVAFYQEAMARQSSAITTSAK